MACGALLLFRLWLESGRVGGDVRSVQPDISGPSAQGSVYGEVFQRGGGVKGGCHGGDKAGGRII